VSLPQVHWVMGGTSADLLYFHGGNGGTTALLYRIPTDTLVWERIQGEPYVWKGDSAVYVGDDVHPGLRRTTTVAKYGKYVFLYGGISGPKGRFALDNPFYRDLWMLNCDEVKVGTHDGWYFIHYDDEDTSRGGSAPSYEGNRVFPGSRRGNAFWASEDVTGEFVVYIRGFFVAFMFHCRISIYSAEKHLLTDRFAESWISFEFVSMRIFTRVLGR